MQFEFDWDKASIKRTIEYLKTTVEDALKRDDLEDIAETGLTMIKLRTQRGNFLEGSKTPARYSPGHARIRRSMGLPVNLVTLFMGEVGVLEGIKTRTTSRKGDISIEIGYLSTTEANAREIGGYLDEEGVGVNKIRYRHIGFTDSERKRLIQLAKDRMRENFRDA
jgi:hypothetical protein